MRSLVYLEALKTTDSARKWMVPLSGTWIESEVRKNSLGWSLVTKRAPGSPKSLGTLNVMGYSSSPVATSRSSRPQSRMLLAALTLGSLVSARSVHGNPGNQTHPSLTL
eukprot:TRINITY_DN2155_c0_g1_i2.p1 TRINITY_DN2155_c0_g1~~TRINITY_DN2155_c0_g1_i2.p1  ORF type:complete len:109 (+),score=1.62 TRINITY_DN2155_c0_g1_i2:40-366(+)